MVKIFKKLPPVKESKFRGTCENCRVVFDCLESELKEPTDTYYGYVRCPKCQKTTYVEWHATIGCRNVVFGIVCVIVIVILSLFSLALFKGE